MVPNHQPGEICVYRTMVSLAVLRKPGNSVQKTLAATGTLARHVPTFTEGVLLGASQGEPTEPTAAIFAFHFRSTFHQFPSVSRYLDEVPKCDIWMKFHLYSYFQHFGTSSSSSRYRRDAVPKKGPSAQRRCPPGAAWWGAHVDSSKVASKYLSAPQVPISPQALKPIWRGRRSNTPHNQ